ncbi:UNVERIFIED_CONTAM: hypothetical protein GTU68_020688, partial [Idotea baltica]|nr:hypothetical protein [Idotea baltica]
MVGDRVWVGGTKRGSISYIGETQFAPGEWAGVALDEPIGKNNGSVAGVRYFQCEPKKGVFSRLTKLTRRPLSDHELEMLSPHPSEKGTPPPTGTPSQTPRKITPSYQGSYQGSDSARKISQINEPVRKMTPSSPGTKSPYVKSGSTSPTGSVKKGPVSSAGYNSDLKIGERVVIDSSSGTKYGVLRYWGRTEFADGVWAGVELDDASGKNDGSVAGKKYFVCRSKFGLFAPVARVRSFANRSSARSSLPLRRSGSRESLGGSSVASSTVSSLRGTRRPSRTSTSGVSPSTKALQ